MSNRFDLRTLLLIALFTMLAFVFFYDQEKAEEVPPGPPVQVITLDKQKPQRDGPEGQEAQLNPWAHKLAGVSITYYDCCVACCGKDDGITFTGDQAVPYETCAVDPAVIPLGSVVTVDYGDGELHHYRAEDTGSGVKGNHIDICVSSHQEALELGRRTATVYWMETEY